MPPTAGKKPLSQAMPEPALEPIQASSIVVIHPGSTYLRIGRAADAFPHTLPHCIARRHKRPGRQPHTEDRWMVRTQTQHGETRQLQRAGLKLAEEAVRYRPLSIGEYRQPTSHKQLSQLNMNVTAEATGVASPLNWTSTQIKPEYIIGEEALYLNPTDCYDLHWPMRYGEINLHSGSGGSLTSAMQDIESIWRYAIQNSLGIPLKDLMHYRAVLLVTDIYERNHVRDMMTIILERLGFGAAFACQESVCATFGAGVSSACVLDVGDMKTSVCCVEDGLSQRKTRLTMKYGGSDVTRVYHWLLSRSGFPYADCDLASRADAIFLQELKEAHCHMDHEQYGMREQHIQVKHPGKHIIKYTIQSGDETILAAMALFFPDLMGLRGRQYWKVHKKSRADPEDPRCEDYLQQTQSRQEMAARAVAARKKEAREAAETGGDDTQIMDDDEDTNDPTETPGSEATPGGTGTKQKKQDEEEGLMDLEDGLLGIDQAILQSIDKCDADDMKKRMYSCIVVVGGGAAMLRGAEGWIKYAVWTQMPPAFRAQLETMDVLARPKEMDPRLVCWKGGAILSCLDTAQELWIRGREWKRFGVRMLRERAPFIW